MAGEMHQPLTGEGGDREASSPRVAPGSAGESVEVEACGLGASGRPCGLAKASVAGWAAAVAATVGWAVPGLGTGCVGMWVKSSVCGASGKLPLLCRLRLTQSPSGSKTYKRLRVAAPADRVSGPVAMTRGTAACPGALPCSCTIGGQLFFGLMQVMYSTLQEASTAGAERVTK